MKELFISLLICHFIGCINYSTISPRPVIDNSVTYKITQKLGTQHEYRLDISKYTVKRLNGSAQYCLIHKYPEIVMVIEKEGEPLEYMVRRWSWFE